MSVRKASFIATCFSSLRYAFLSYNSLREIVRGVFGAEKVVVHEGGIMTETGLEATSTRRIVKARGYAGLAPGEALARALGVALALGCVSPRR